LEIYFIGGVNPAFQSALHRVAVKVPLLISALETSLRDEARRVAAVLRWIGSLFYWQGCALPSNQS
jgi:hypothetical protein